MRGFTALCYFILFIFTFLYFDHFDALTSRVLWAIVIGCLGCLCRSDKLLTSLSAPHIIQVRASYAPLGSTVRLVRRRKRWRSRRAAAQSATSVFPRWRFLVVFFYFSLQFSVHESPLHTVEHMSLAPLARGSFVVTSMCPVRVDFGAGLHSRPTVVILSISGGSHHHSLLLYFLLGLYSCHYVLREHAVSLF